MPFVEYLRAKKTLGLPSNVIVYSSDAWVNLAKEMLQYFAIQEVEPVCF